MSIFETLNAINVNEHTEKKVQSGTSLTYLSWCWAVSELKKNYPEANYKVKTFDGKPYLYDENLGYMVMTEVTVDGLTHEMWLPVMDGANRAMKKEPYEVTNKYGKTSTIAAATMTDINKTIMRCLTKNIGMFGLGLYIYAGEDLPEGDEPVKEEPKAKAPAKAAKEEPRVTAIKSKCKTEKVSQEKVLALYKVSSWEEMSDAQYSNMINNWDKVAERCGI